MLKKLCINWHKLHSGQLENVAGFDKVTGWCVLTQKNSWGPNEKSGGWLKNLGFKIWSSNAPPLQKSHRSMIRIKSNNEINSWTASHHHWKTSSKPYFLAVKSLTVSYRASTLTSHETGFQVLSPNTKETKTSNLPQQYQMGCPIRWCHLISRSDMACWKQYHWEIG